MRRKRFDLLRTPLQLLNWAGVDEAGRGPLAGPVVAAAVVLDPERPILGLRDSKKLSPKKREALFDLIVSQALAQAVSVVDVACIDSINILQASLLAMSQACQQIQMQCEFPGVLVDGNQTFKHPTRLIQQTVVGGDDIWPAIMAASILAKVTRDRMMLEFDKQYQGYGFAQHKGYGTKAHIEALARLGRSPIHRKSFQISCETNKL